ncbi:MAG: NADH dehydrogenase subunit [Ignavibacteriae bacterium]|nr:NADH dehydrogenase subunit [Ignavibacteriota bacterium]NOG96516.1 NADH dehydrogenase subunit [Ignavibacteriota bacterium]
MSVIEKIFNAGVVGAGGAGFPTHVKAKAEVEIVLANGAECEPLLHKDYEIMLNFAPEIVNGMEIMMEQTKASKGYFGIKGKNALAAEAIQNKINGNIEMTFLGDFYPSGDEYELVYAATKRLMPPYGIPLDVGCIVNNVETFYNVARAMDDIPVTEKFICVAGLVNKPSTFFAPVGTTIKEVLEHAGGASINDYAVFESGILMGNLTFDFERPVTKTSGGYIVLPKTHYLVDRMNRNIESMNRIGKSACDQCTYCTELCPRYLLGYDVQPHKVMRSLEFTKSGEALWNQFADLCCSCGLCSLYSCPEDLYPREACDQGKAENKKMGTRYEQPKPVKVHPIKDGRRVPLKQLMKKIDLYNYQADTPFNKEMPDPKRVKIMLQQHIGAAAKTKVKEGSPVKKGDMIGEIEDGKLGAPVHSSINGKIEEVTETYIVISK